MLLFDLHCDTASRIYKDGSGLVNNKYQISLDKCNKYEEYIQVFAMWIDAKKIKSCKKYAVNMINYFKRKAIESGLISEYGAMCNKKIKYILSVEGGEALEDNLENVAFFRRKGVKLITLVWNYKNLIATPSAVDDFSGITNYGIEVIRKMNEENLIVDLSHINLQGFFEAAMLADKPIVSHSNSFSVCNNKRNITDEQFKIIKSKNGLIGINYYPYFLNNSDKADVNDIIRHIYHFLSLGGEKNICIGSDFDGIDCNVEGFDDINSHFILAEEMLKINFSEKIIADILYNNCNNYFIFNKI